MVPCTYCGVVADSMDHIPPMCMRNVLNDLGNYIGVWREVPSCRWCNSTLGSLALLTVHDRRAHIKSVLRRKYKRLLASPIWTEQELSEVSENLRAYIVESMKRASLVRAMVAWDGQSREARMPTASLGRVWEPGDGNWANRPKREWPPWATRG